MNNTVKKNPSFNIWEGIYSNFQEADKFRVGLGFSGITYSKRSMEAALECQMALENNQPIPIFHKQRSIYLPITVGMMLGSADKIKVLDFGGGLGIGYMTLQESIGIDIANVNYNIIEVPEVCRIASDLHVGTDLVYTSHLPNTGVFDLIHAASSIQYIEEWKNLLINFTQLEPEYILLSGIFAGDIQSYATLQNYYESKIPHWMLNVEEILQLFKLQGYKLVMKGYANSRRLDVQDILPMMNFPKKCAYLKHCIYYLEKMSTIDLGGLNGKSVVVTGAGGYIGSQLVNELLKQSCEVILVCRQVPTFFENSILIKGDIQSRDVWRQIVGRADVIYHLAGNTSIYEAAKNPVESLNLALLPINHLIDALQNSQSKPRVIFASTATVYGLTPRSPVSEIFESMPITIYDLHKLFVEQQLSLASRQGLIESVSLRLSNVYGPSLGVSAEDRGILNKITVKALNGENLLIYGDGNYLRGYVYMDDVVRAFLLTGSKRDIKSGVYNVSSGKSVSVKEAFKMVASQVSLYTGKSVNVDYAPWPIGASPIEYRDYIADNKCISSQFGWYPKVTLESGIHRMVEGAIKARKGIKAFQ